MVTSRYGHVATKTPLCALATEDGQDSARYLSEGRPYPCLDCEESLNAIFSCLEAHFHFQRDNSLNQLQSLCILIGSRGSRMPESEAILSIHREIISGKQSSYWKWYMCHQQLLMSEECFFRAGDMNGNLQTLWELDYTSSENQLLTDLALYFLIWGEAANLRFCPEWICFVFKLARDNFLNARRSDGERPVMVIPFLEHTVKPIYRILHQQLFRVNGNQQVRRNRDHTDIIGYDDINEFFWHSSCLRFDIKLPDGRLLMELPKQERYNYLGKANFGFKKTYYERRSGLHLLVNFVGIWVAHWSAFYYLFASCIAPKIFDNSDFVRVAIGLGGGVSVVIVLCSTLMESCFVPSVTLYVRHYCYRLVLLFSLFLLNMGIPVIVILSKTFGIPTAASLTLSIVQILLSVGTTIWCIFFPRFRLTSVKPSVSQFVHAFAPMKKDKRALSVTMWILIAVCKLLTSYMFLILPFYIPMVELLTYYVSVDDMVIRSFIIVLVSVYVLLNFTLFHLDTYVWYIIWTTIIGIARALQISKPWIDNFDRLPERLMSKVLYPANDHQSANETLTYTAKLWNGIAISLFQNHLISKDQAELMMYQPVESNSPITLPWKRPSFFERGTNSSIPGHLSDKSEASRRIKFLCKSLTMFSSPCMKYDQIPVFTVLTPHFSEKIIWSIKDLLNGDMQGISLLDYLKCLYPDEWKNFVNDSMVYRGARLQNYEEANSMSIRALGFETSDHNECLRTRIWASLRSQTLFRTVSGFMAYNDAMKLFSEIESDSSAVSIKKFYFVVAIQNYSEMSEKVLEEVELLLETFAGLQIAYLETEPTECEGELLGKKFYSCLINAECDYMSGSLRRKPLYRIQLPGPSILGDGKSDNQNHCLPFTRGEFIQLIDANQDQYLEEALKIRSFLSEFKIFDPARNADEDAPVAIVGAREHIFSQGIGSLGDVAAGKEMTFGTITQRVITLLGARCSYGHPDLVNRTFMITKGGISKGQKGLHLNEDIYAGMMAYMRGGIISHTEYIQCGKGRDLGFSSVLGFASKIGSGMGEQILSREQYHLGISLPLDRLCTFYYAHTGFHINNLAIMLSIRLFGGLFFLLGVLHLVVKQCVVETEPDSLLTIYQLSSDSCVHMISITTWIRSSVISILFVLFVPYLPFVLQCSIENGPKYAIVRLAKQILSLTPIYEIFSTQIYAYTLSSIGLCIGGSSYVSTGRGFAIERIPFYRLFSSFSKSSIQLGVRLLLALVVGCVLKEPAIVFFFLIAVSLCVAPFLFNPSAFIFTDFMVDYLLFLKWLFREQGSESWICFHISNRSRFLGNVVQTSSEKKVTRSNKLLLFFQEVFVPFFVSLCFILGYGYLETQTKKRNASLLSFFAPVLFALIPFVVNFAVLLLMFCLMLVLRLLMGYCFGKFVSGIGLYFAYAAKVVAVIVLWMNLVLVWIYEGYSIAFLVHAIVMLYLQRTLLRLIQIALLGKEYAPQVCNDAWWSADWQVKSLGWRCMYLPFRELVCKVCQQLHFATDFLVGHLLILMLLPLSSIPNISKFHSLMLFWVDTKGKESNLALREKVYPSSEKLRRSRNCISACILLNSLVLLFIAPFVLLPLIGLRLTVLSLPTEL